MLSTDQILQQAAEDGSLDAEEWPRVLESILSRLDEIINQFPKPSIPNSEPPPNLPTLESPNKTQEIPVSSQESTSADKENAPPATPPRPPVPSFSGASTQVDGTPSSSQESRTFPPDILAFYASIRNTLTKNFSKNPPHTIQRLAELLLEPKARYRFLPSYLRALDRVISVSSPSTIFPLPLAVLPNNTGTLLNGSTPVATNTLGSDESLGGALLTPIPWLRSNQQSQSELVSESTEMVDGPNGAGRIETVSVMNGSLTSGAPAPNTSSEAPDSSLPSSNGSEIETPSEPGSSASSASLRDVGGVTQGELLRQEQQAGVVPGNQQTSTAHAESGYVADTVEGEEEAPHARGPEEMTMEDMGPQDTNRRGGLDIEAAVGRSAVKSPQPEAPPKEEDMKDAGEEQQDEKKEGGEESGDGENQAETE